MEIPALEGQARGQNRSHGPGEFPSAQTQMGSTPKSLLAAHNSNSALLLMNPRPALGHLQPRETISCGKSWKEGSTGTWKCSPGRFSPEERHSRGQGLCWQRAGLGCVDRVRAQRAIWMLLGPVSQDQAVAHLSQ